MGIVQCLGSIATITEHSVRRESRRSSGPGQSCGRGHGEAGTQAGRSSKVLQDTFHFEVPPVQNTSQEHKDPSEYLRPACEAPNVQGRRRGWQEEPEAEDKRANSTVERIRLSWRLSYASSPSESECKINGGLCEQDLQVQVEERPQPLEGKEEADEGRHRGRAQVLDHAQREKGQRFARSSDPRRPPTADGCLPKQLQEDLAADQRKFLSNTNSEPPFWRRFNVAKPNLSEQGAADPAASGRT